MEIKTRSVGDYIVLDLLCPEDDSPLAGREENFSAFEFELRKNQGLVMDKVSEVLASGFCSIALNLMQAEYIHSGGIGVLTRILQRVRQANGRFCVIAKNSGIREVIETIGLDQAIQLFSNEDEFLRMQA